MTPDEMKNRTKVFALRVIRLCNALPRTPAAQIVRSQLLRSGTSVGSNYRTSCRSRSTAEFVARMGVVEEEADESAYWMELICDAEMMSPRKVTPLRDKAEELCRIASSSRKTAGRRESQTGPNRNSEFGIRK